MIKTYIGIPPIANGWPLTDIYATTDIGGDVYPIPGATPSSPSAFDQSLGTRDGTYGPQIPEFSTLLIPIIGTIALFTVFRKYKKK